MFGEILVGLSTPTEIGRSEDFELKYHTKVILLTSPRPKLPSKKRKSSPRSGWIEFGRFGLPFSLRDTEIPDT